jgi:lysine 2,3-aminomutase
LRTTLAQGQELMRDLRGRVSGLCQPDYVLDIPGGHGKAPVGPNYLSPVDARSGTAADSFAKPDSFAKQSEREPELRYRVVDYCGDVHLYPPSG